MPLWRIFAHPSTFSPEQRVGLAKAATDIYAVHGIPPFYVVVLFVDLEENSLWIGGERKQNFVRITIEQIARQLPDPKDDKGKKFRKQWLDQINRALKPFIQDRPELLWEYHISETPIDLWRVQGLDPPPPGSEAEKLWFKENKASDYKL